MDFDIIVIGSGPGGYHAALRATQLGLKVACVEKQEVGGVCLNVGCIPTKALLHASSSLSEAKHAEDFGVSFGKPKVNLKKLEEWKQGVINKMTGGVKMLFKGNKVELIAGEAKFKDAHTITVNKKDYSADKFIIASGSSAIEIPGFKFDEQTIVSSTGALLVSEIPKRFMAIGGSAIGLEFADIYNALGSQVTVVELMDKIVPTADKDASRELTKALKAKGIDIKTATKAISQKKNKKAIDVILEAKDGSQETISVDKLLVAVGRKPNGKGLGLEEIGVNIDERGFVSPANEHMQTNLSHIYTIGDVARMPLLAHKAMKEAIVAAEHASGMKTAYDTIVPGVIYTQPELASVGMTEKEAKDAGYAIRIGKFPMAASGRAASLGQTAGLIKVVADEKTDILLGFHMVGPNAGDIVAEATLAIEMGATLEDIALTQHPHPTIAESFMEAAEHAHGKAIHIANRRPRKKK